MSKEKTCKYTSIGGQAVMEGIMMRGSKKSVLAVRTPDNSIVVEDVKTSNIAQKYKFLKWPVLRGVVGFIDSMMVGFKTLMRSAELSGMTDIEEEEQSDKEQEEKSEPEKEKDKKESGAFFAVLMTIASILGVVLAIFLFMYVPTLLFNGLKSVVKSDISNLRALIEGVIKIIIFIGYILAISQMKDIKRVFQYHGAEHKTIFCFESGAELTVENVRKMRRFHPRCGTSFMFLMIVVGILFSTLVVVFFPGVTKNAIVWTFVKILMIPLFCGVGYELIKFCGRHDNLATRIISAPGLWIQRITTKEPADEMIEVAIKSIKAVLPQPEPEVESAPELEPQFESELKSENPCS